MRPDVQDAAMRELVGGGDKIRSPGRKPGAAYVVGRPLPVL